jgi:PAS domain S-box-containing protein
MSTFHFTKKRFVIALLCTLFILTVAGWVFTGYLVGMATRMVERELENANEIISINLTSELKRIETAATATAGSPLTLPVLQANTPENIEKANNILDRYHKALDAAACYLIDKNGLTLTSSNRNEKDSFVGQNYTFRSYFQQAIKGGIGHLFAYGTVSKRRGFYASAPVRNKEGQIVGVVAIKKELEDIEIKLKQYIWFLVDQSGIIFMSSQPEARLKSLWPLSDEQHQKIILSKQYGPGPFEPVLQKRFKDKAEVTFQGGQYLTSQNVTPYEGISVVLLRPTGQISMYRSFGIVLTLLGLLLTLSFLATVYTFTQSNIRMETLLKESQSQAAALADSEGQLRVRTDELESQKTELLHARQAAESARARSDTLFNASTSAHVIINSMAQIVNCNDTFLRLLGYASLEDVAGKHPAALAPPLQPDGRNSMEKGIEMVGIAIERGRHVFDWMCQSARGEAILVEVTIIPLMLDGEPYLMGIWHDLTERKEAEEAIRTAEERSRSILNAINVGTMIIDPDTKFIEDVNPVAANMIGLPKEQIIGRRCHHFVCMSDEDQCPITDHGQTIDNSERMMLNARGEKIPVIKTVVPMVLGSRKLLLESFIDITQRKETEELANAYFNSSADGLLILSPERGFINANKTAAAMFGFENIDDLIKCGPVELSPPYQPDGRPSQEAAMEYITKAMQMDAMLRFDWIHRRTNGTEFPCEIALLQILLAGQKHLLTNIRDITERKQAEKELRGRMEELERFSRLTVNREKMMIQLKEEINTLLVQAGQEKKYKIVEASQANS